MAVTKQQFGVLCTTMTHWCAPVKMRPLKGRVNVVVSSRSAVGPEGGQVEERRDTTSERGGGEGIGDGPVWVRSLEDGLRMCGSTVGRVFVIGGSMVYRSALEAGVVERVLWTRVRKVDEKGEGSGEWECDTWFPRGVLPGEEDGDADKIVGGGSRDGQAAGREQERKWRQASDTELEEWTG